MSRTKKPSPLEAFEANITDAETLLAYAEAFENERTYRMRKELRVKVGEAFRIGVRDQEQLDLLESDDLFVIFKPGGELTRDHFNDRRPLLRQSLVAACAAFETYVADKAMECLGPVLRSKEPPPRLRDIPLSVGRWLDIEEHYERKGWGVRLVIEEYLRELSSSAPGQVGKVLASVGVSDWASKVDTTRGVSKGTTVIELEAIAQHRNRIAHTGDRSGQGRAQLTSAEVRENVSTLRSVVSAIESLLGPPSS